MHHSSTHSKSAETKQTVKWFQSTYRQFHEKIDTFCARRRFKGTYHRKFRSGCGGWWYQE